MVELHQDDMDQVEDDQDPNGKGLNTVADHEVGLETHVDDEQGAISSRDPPVDNCALWGQFVESTGDDQG